VYNFILVDNNDFHVKMMEPASMGLMNSTASARVAFLDIRGSMGEEDSMDEGTLQVKGTLKVKGTLQVKRTLWMRGLYG